MLTEPGKSPDHGSLTSSVDWLAEARNCAPEAVLDRLGLHGSRRTRWPCPACGAVRERAGIKRGPLAILDDNRRWRCNSCNRLGDSVDLVSWVLLSRDTKGLPPGEWLKLREWFGVSTTPTTRHTAPTTPPAPDYPPQPQVQTFWFGLPPLPDHATFPLHRPTTPPDPEVVDRLAGVSRPWWYDAETSIPALWCWLRSRGIPPEVVSWLDLIRPAPQTPPAPSQDNERRVAGYGWPYCAVVPLFDATGLIRSVLFRAVAAYPGPKSMALRGWDRAGLVMADPMGRALLAATGEPEPVDMRAGALVEWNGAVVICEGEVDFLTAATGDRINEDHQTYAVLAIPGASGGLPPAIAARIPKDARVLVYPHRDSAGAGATARTVKVLRQAGVEAEVIEIPAKDLNELSQHA